MRNKRGTTGLKQKSYIIAAAIMLVAAFGMTGIYYSQQNKKQEAKLAREQEETELAAKAEARKQEAAESERLARETAEQEQLAEETAGMILPENSDFLDAPGEAATQEAPAQPAALHFAAEELRWPLLGNVIMNYSMDQTIYFATLEQYKYNPAIIIQAEVNTPVEAVAEGKITAVKTTAETGTTVTVDLGDGYSAIYGQLKEIAWKTGETVKAGEVIGYVSEPTKYYSVEGSNLYFALTKDKAPVNPMEYLE